MQQQPTSKISNTRLDLFYGVVVLVFAIFIVRLFYIQVIQHKYYAQAAQNGQYKEYEIPAERGIITAHDGDTSVPIVLNEDTYTVFADPKYIKDPKKTAEDVAKVVGGNPSDYEQKIQQPTRYAILAKRISKSQNDQITGMALKGIGLRTESVRTYPQGALAAQLLGFVNDEGKGTYGIEQALDTQLRGKPGELKAITDVRGVPLAANGDNIRKDPTPGKQVALTIDLGMQRKVEDMLKDHVPSVKAKSGSVIVMDPYTGAIKAMANYPSYNPAEFYKVKDPGLFNNASVSYPFEVGSIMKTLTVAAGMNEGVINANTSYQDPGYWKVDDATIRNVEEDGGAATRSTADILRYSLNTGATWVLMQLGGGKINDQARNKWFDYLTKHYGFGKKTGIEQGYEADGFVPDPNDGYGLNIQYANTAFGQGINITPIQFIAAFSATINGGKYYKPHLVEPSDGKPILVNGNALKPEISEQMMAMHENSVNKNYTFLKRTGYKVGGKTGTAEIPKPGGGYYDDRYNGTFVGYVGGDMPRYVIIVSMIEPHVPGYAGTKAAAPMFGKVVDMLINNYSISPMTP